MDEITRVPNGGIQCRYQATIANQPVDPKRFAPGDTCLCEEGWTLYKASLDMVWTEM